MIDFLWVGKAVEALTFAAENGRPGPVNIGSGTGTRILDLAARVLMITVSTSKVGRVAPRELEVAKYVADTRVMRSLGLLPDADPLEHLAELVDGFRG